MATLSKLQKKSLETLRVLSLLLYKPPIQVSIVLSGGMLVNKESTSRLDIYKLGFVNEFLQQNQIKCVMV